MRSFTGRGRETDHGGEARLGSPAERQALRRLHLHAQALSPPRDQGLSGRIRRTGPSRYGSARGSTRFEGTAQFPGEGPVEYRGNLAG
ncbi:hypothetical protein [Streptomyces acidicola]|uniref:hypothetical protein n=1 Tax=Streptomyces acidicola TaxID=2596892 RepID=UPI001D15ACCB